MIERLVAEGAGRLRGHDRLRRPGHDVHRPGRRRPAPGEPADEPRRRRRAGRSRARSCGRCSCSGPTRSPSATAAAGRSSIDRLLELLAAGIHPVVPEQGIVGASGDLAPLAHLALPLIGRGEVEFHGQRVPALLALREAGLEPLILEAKEGLALLNGTQMMSRDRGARPGRRRPAGPARRASPRRCRSRRCSAPTSRSRPPTSSPGRIPGQIAVAAELRHLLRDSTLQTSHHGHAHKVQDPYSLRCVPQVHGAVRDALDHLRRVLDDRAQLRRPTTRSSSRAAAAPTPTTLATGGGLVISGGNFHGEPIALAARLRQARRRRARLDQRAADGAARRRPPERRPAAVPRRGLRARLGADDPPVHGGRPRLGEQGPRPSGVGRLDPDERQPGRPRVDGLDRGPPRPDGPRARRADRRDRADRAPPRRSTSGSALRPGTRARGRASRGAHAAVRAVVPALARRPRARARTSPRRSPSSTTAARRAGRPLRRG